MMNFRLDLEDFELVDNNAYYMATAEGILRQIGSYDLDEADFRQINRRIWELHDELVPEEDENYIDAQCYELTSAVRKAVETHKEAESFNWADIEELFNLE